MLNLEQPLKSDLLLGLCCQQMFVRLQTQTLMLDGGKVHLYALQLLGYTLIILFLQLQFYNSKETHSSTNTDCLIIPCAVWRDKTAIWILEVVLLQAEMSKKKKKLCSKMVLATKFTSSHINFPVLHIRGVKRDNWIIYLSVCCVQSLQETGHQGRASRSCSQHTSACSPRRSSPTG